MINKITPILTIATPEILRKLYAPYTDPSLLNSKPPSILFPMITATAFPSFSTKLRIGTSSIKSPFKKLNTIIFFAPKSRDLSLHET